MTRTPARPRRHYLAPFRHNLFVCTTRAHWDWFKKRHPVPDGWDEGGAEGITWCPDQAEGRRPEIGVYIDAAVLERLTMAELVDTIAHEAVHVKDGVLTNIGETENTREIEPYLVGYVARLITADLERHLDNETR